MGNNYIPCVEFTEKTLAYTTTQEVLDSRTRSGTYKNTYWPMWKLPMFGCTDPYDVIREIAQCKKAYPECYIRVIGFDNIAQVQCVSFLVHRPPGCDERQDLKGRRKGP